MNPYQTRIEGQQRMTRILHLDSSPGDDLTSYSRRVSADLVKALVASSPEAQVHYCDLARQPPPHVDGALRAGWTTSVDQRSPPLVQAVTRSEGYIAELIAADIVVIGAPMYNFSVPSTLKAWIDHILIAGQTFRYTAEGKPEGLVLGKKSFLVLARGGVYSNGPMTAIDHQEPYLRAVLGMIGIIDVQSILVEGVAFGPDRAQAALDQAREAAIHLATSLRIAA